MGTDDRFEQAKGKVREEAGKATGDKSEEAKGKLEQAKGKAGQMADDARDKFKDATN